MNNRDLEQKLRKVELLEPSPQAKREVMQEAERRWTLNRRLRTAVIALAAAAAILFALNFVADDFIPGQIHAFSPLPSVSTVECARVLRVRQELILETLEFNVNGDREPADPANCERRSLERLPAPSSAESRQTAPDPPPEGSRSNQGSVD